MSKSAAVIVGIDMGATHLRFCLASLQGELLKQQQEKSREITRNGLLSGLMTLIHNHVIDADIAAIVIGLPALISHDNQVLSVPNLPCDLAEFEELTARLQQQFHCPVVLTRDVNLQLTYDVVTHRLQDEIVLGCYIGTGFGLSIWIKGDIYLGAHGVAGELGHIPSGDEAVRCGCGNYGCLETLCSGQHLERWYQQKERPYSLTELFTQPQQEAALIQFIHDSAKAIATAVNLFDPHSVILGGGVVDMNSFPFAQLTEKIRYHTRKPLPENKLSFFKANSSAFNGACGAVLIAQQLTMGTH